MFSFDYELQYIQANLRITYDGCNYKDFAPIGIDVELNSIAEGIDAVVNFEFMNAHNGTFYTDSNGLEMQKRTIDYRPSWPYGEYEPGHQNISSNYYPVGSAVSYKNQTGSRAYTVTIDRTVAGTAGAQRDKNNTIEFIQNRRLTKDDQRGVGEALNETDSDGMGIKVNAHYNVLITDGSSTLQRKIQVEEDLPLQIFYGMGTNTQTNTYYDFSSLSNSYDGMNWDGSKMVVFAKDLNSLNVRLENLNDKYDN